MAPADPMLLKNLKQGWRKLPSARAQAVCMNKMLQFMIALHLTKARQRSQRKCVLDGFNYVFISYQYVRYVYHIIYDIIYHIICA